MDGQFPRGEAIVRFRALDLADVRTLLCDADGNLFPSEEPAFEASTEVTNRLLRDLGVARQYTPGELRRVALGRSFRATAASLVSAFGVALDPGELERRVLEEKERVSAYLGEILGPDPEVIGPLTDLARRFGLAAVSSSAASRLDACLAATQLDGLFPEEVRFSAEDSLPVPTSKPDPAVFVFAGERLGLSVREGLAIEDSVPGAQSAVAAGFETIGNLCFVAPEEQAERTRALHAAGVGAVVSSWRQLVSLLDR